MNKAYKPEKLHILIIDDNPPIRKAMKKVLINMDIKNITEAANGREAISLLEKNHFDLVLTDLFMNNVNGFEVLKYIRGRQVASDIPILTVTGEGKKEDIVKASDLGANDYLLKPFQAEDLENKVDRILTRFFSPTELLKVLRGGDRLLIERKAEQSLAYFEQALRLSPSSRRAKHSLAVAYSQLERTDEAILLLEDNIKESESYYKNYTTLADLYLKAKNYPAAIAAISKELELNPRQEKRQTQLARLYMNEGDPITAISCLREALKENSKYKPALISMAKCFASTGDIDKAIYYYKRIRRYHKDETQALEGVVKESLKINAPRRAEIVLIDEMKAHPGRFDTYCVLSRFYIKTNNYENAFKTLDRLFLRKANHLEGLKIKGALHMRLKEYKEASDTFRRVLKIETSVDILLATADCYGYLNKMRNNLSLITKALIMEPRNPKVLYHLALGFRKTKQVNKAIPIFLKAMQFGYHPQKCQEHIELCKKSIAEQYDKNSTQKAS